jgi:hypothetical protein
LDDPKSQRKKNRLPAPEEINPNRARTQADTIRRICGTPTLNLAGSLEEAEWIRHWADRNS